MSKNYIATQHAYGMKSIFYNLCFGAWKDAANDGVKSQWALMKKDGNGNYYQDYHGLPLLLGQTISICKYRAMAIGSNIWWNETRKCMVILISMVFR